MSEGDNWLFLPGDNKLEDCAEFGSELGEIDCGEFGGELGGFGNCEVDCGDTSS